MTQAQCLKCLDVIESKFRHDFRWCKCKNIYVDGGTDYFRCGGKLEDILIRENEHEAFRPVIDEIEENND